MSDLQVLTKMAGRETKFCLQLSERGKVVVNVKIYDGNQAFVGPLYKSSIHRAWFNIGILTNRSIGSRGVMVHQTVRFLTHSLVQTSVFKNILKNLLENFQKKMSGFYEKNQDNQNWGHRCLKELMGRSWLYQWQGSPAWVCCYGAEYKQESFADKDGKPPCPRRIVALQYQEYERYLYTYITLTKYNTSL